MRKIVYITILCLLSIHLLSVEGRASQNYYRVKKGDTLYKIARNYNVSVTQIKRTNDITGSRIIPGNVIVIPGNKAVKNKKTESKPSNVTTHQVRKGETLYRISRMYHASVQEVKRLNNLSGNLLKIGQKLKVPAVSRADEEVPLVIEEPAEQVEIAVADNEAESGVEASMADGQESLAMSSSYDMNRIEEDESNWFTRIVDTATEYLGVPYRFGGTTLSGIDCSAYVQMVYRYFSIELPRTAREQFKAGIRLSSKKELEIGDLIFFRTYAKFPSHVGIYIGEGKMIHASSRDKKVTVSSIHEPYYVKRYIGAVRLPENPAIVTNQKLTAVSSH